MENDKSIMNGERIDLEAMLADILVPVDPRPRFSKRLRAKLVHYRGARPFSGWTAVVVLASLLLMMVSLVGMLARFVGLWVRLIGALSRRRRLAG